MAGLWAPADCRYHGQTADWAAQNTGPALNIDTAIQRRLAGIVSISHNQSGLASNISSTSTSP